MESVTGIQSQMFTAKWYARASSTKRYDGNTARLARRSDEALGVRVSVARIAPSLLDLERADYSPPTMAYRVRFPTGSPRIFACENRAGRCRWSAGFLGDLPFPPPFHYCADPYSHRFTLIGSQDLDVKSRPNLFTQSAAISSGPADLRPRDKRRLASMSPLDASSDRQRLARSCRFWTVERVGGGGAAGGLQPFSSDVGRLLLGRTSTTPPSPGVWLAHGPGLASSGEVLDRQLSYFNLNATGSKQCLRKISSVAIAHRLETQTDKRAAKWHCRSSPVPRAGAQRGRDESSALRQTARGRSLQNFSSKMPDNERQETTPKGRKPPQQEYFEENPPDIGPNIGTRFHWLVKGASQLVYRWFRRRKENVKSNAKVLCCIGGLRQDFQKVSVCRELLVEANRLRVVERRPRLRSRRSTNATGNRVCGNMLFVSRDEKLEERGQAVQGVQCFRHTRLRAKNDFTENVSVHNPLKRVAFLEISSAFEPGVRGSDKDDTDTRVLYPITPTRRALKWRSCRVQPNDRVTASSPVVQAVRREQRTRVEGRNVVASHAPPDVTRTSSSISASHMLSLRGLCSCTSKVKKQGSDTGDSYVARLAPHRSYAQGVQCFRRDAVIRKSRGSRETAINNKVSEASVRRHRARTDVRRGECIAMESRHSMLLVAYPDRSLNGPPASPPATTEVPVGFPRGAMLPSPQAPPMLSSSG
ncbi:hypothetical protein PR048_014588 [Dryococelus australis]|uniref:Uncharacterized protein n=1 Tax=Dryococelus australis TaxID=614101 RepID=A0ABQ9HEU6_9NEOP|nr:hypothetical protein PR048_014588 [Dryococelus australis]